MDNKILRGYMSHCIRGRKGDSCPQEEKDQNCIKAATDGAQIMSIMQRCMIPVFLYVPGSHDEFIQAAWKAGRITESSVLETDCDIVATCDFLLLYDWQDYLSAGMKYEIDYATKHEIPIIPMNKIDQQSLWELQHCLLELLLTKINQPNIIQLHGDTNEH